MSCCMVNRNVTKDKTPTEYTNEKSADKGSIRITYFKGLTFSGLSDNISKV